MQFWKPHALAKPAADQLDLRMNDRVRAIVDLPGVAAGAEGKVILANGFNWQRYRVLFSERRRARRPRPALRSSRSARPPSASPSRPPPRLMILLRIQHRFGASCSRERTATAMRQGGEPYTQALRGVAQPGSAPALGAGGRGFKSPLPDRMTAGRRLDRRAVVTWWSRMR